VTGTLSIADAAERFSVEPGYFDTASVGAPPDATREALQTGVAAWSAGRARAQDYDRYVA
jgi:hypothetical protein